MSHLLEILGRGLLAELAAAFRGVLIDNTDIPTDGLKRLVSQFPDKHLHHLRLGVRLLNTHRPTDALESFERSLQLDPTEVAAVLGKACAYDNCGLLPEATAAVKNALTANPEDPAVHFAMGFCCEKSGNTDLAKEHYTKAVEYAPRLRNAHERLAALYFRENKLTKAIEHYDQLCWYEPGDIDLSLTLANLLLKANRPYDAIQRYQYALTMDPDNWEAGSDLAAAYEEAGQYGEAIEQLRQSIEDQPEFPDNYLRLGDLYVRVGETEKALQAYTDAIKINPDYLEAHVKLGTLNIRESNYENAAQSFNKAIELNDRLLSAYVGLSVAQLDANQPEQAAATMDMASGVEPNSTVLFSEMARLQLKASVGRQSDKYLSPMAVTATEDSAPMAGETDDLIDEQIKRHKAAARNHPHYADLHYRLGVLLKHRGRLEEAIDSFQHALSINPNYVKAIIKLGLAYKEKGLESIAIDTFKNAISVDPHDVQLHYELGLIFADREQFSLAIEQFEYAVKHDPLNVDFRANLALSLQNMGLIDRATATWQALCEIAPETERGRDVLCQLNKRN